MSPNIETKSIQAAVIRQPGGPFRIESVELAYPREDEVLVRLVASGICHTDISEMDGWTEALGPIILGHEGAGVVEMVGQKVTGFKPGDHVLLSFQSCGQCPPCQAGRPAHCERFFDVNFGFQRIGGSNAYGNGIRGHYFGQSSFATHTLVTERNAIKIPAELPLETFASLGCGMQTGAGVVFNSLQIPKDASVAIFGTGAVGLAALMAAKIVGAFPIIGVDIVRERLELALELGATHALDGSKENIVAGLRSISRGGIDFVIETTGKSNLRQSAEEVLAPQGTLAIFSGESGERPLTKGRKILGVLEGDAVPQQFLPRLIELHRAGQFPFDRLLKFYPFSEINQAVADARRGITIKPVLRME